MSDFTELSKKVIEIARGEDKKKPSPYDTKATVNRVDYENRKAYVRFYGGVDETPVDLTVNCERGDTVQVRVGGGRAWIVGNQTAPPTDDKAVNILKHTVNNLQGNLDKTREDLEKEIEEIEPGEGKLIERIATEYILSELNYLVNDEVVPYEPTPGEPMEWSEELPEWVPSPRTYFWKRTVIYYTDGTIDEQDPILDANAQISAEADYAISSENNHFWHDSSGAYVTEQNKNAALGYASRVTNAGILQTYNGNLLTAWTGSGVSFYDGSGSTAATSKMLAAFYSSGITFDTTTPFTIGNTNSYIKWINTGTELSPNWKLQINADTIQFGGTDIEDIVDPYEIKTNVDSIVSDPENYTTTPTSITSQLYKDGASTSAVIKVERSTNGTYWTEFYSSSVPVGSSTFNVNSYYNYKYIRISYYEEYRSSESPYFFGLLKQKMLPMIAVGETGPQGPAGTDVTSQYVTYISSASGVVVRHAGNNDSYPYLKCNASGVYMYSNDYNYAQMTTSGLDIYQGSSSPEKVASFGSTVQIGKNNTDHINIGSGYVDLYRQSYRSIHINTFSNSYGGESTEFSAIASGDTSGDAYDEGYIALGYGTSGYSYAVMQAFNRRSSGYSGIVSVEPNEIEIGCSSNTDDVHLRMTSSAISIDKRLFSVSEETISISANSTGAASNTKNISKSKYYPLGVVGVIITTTGASSRGFYLTSRSTGSATLNGRIWATSTGSKSCTAYVLWTRNTI